MKVSTRAYLTTRELAERCGVSPRTVEGWRNNGLGPTYTRVGHRVMYRETDVTAWEDSEVARAQAEKDRRAKLYRARMERDAMKVGA
ncbi:Helix-turn-helix domain [Mycobacteroides abscessus subsp. abscessus]|uniref:helix-turn-helix transcriptional regulator n=1 Tax=Mycobacteroides abscessus TaxID=36809 RepID=UPI0009A90BF5|nr:helix-turn-helix domain-containing protein [Mycobacteroides abscessus]SKV12250.1 Helix-turn-helix domain [Mycobacteroides abscessus subsp. abscessus]